MEEGFEEVEGAMEHDVAQPYKPRASQADLDSANEQGAPAQGCRRHLCSIVLPICATSSIVLPNFPNHRLAHRCNLRPWTLNLRLTATTGIVT